MGKMSREWFGDSVATHVKELPGLPALVVLLSIYSYSGYFFGSLTANAVAMYVPFLTVTVAVGTPPLFATLTPAFFSSVGVSLTQYGGGSAPVCYGAT